MNIRKFAATAIASLTIGAAALATAMPACATTRDGYYLTTANSYLALREGAGTQYAEVDRLGYGTSVNVDHFEGNWASVYVPDRDEYGYVYNDYIVPDENSENNSEVPFYITEGTPKTCSVTETYLALRSAPENSADNEIGKILPGQQVNVQWNTDNGYAFVYVPALNRTGYVNASCIE